MSLNYKSKAINKNSDKSRNSERLVISSISKSFGATVALDNVSLSVATGQVHALVGENGAGKSTLMKVLSGAIKPDSGSITLDGQPYAPASPLLARLQGVAMIYQELSLAPHLTVEENLLLGVEPGRWGLLNRGVGRRKALQALSELAHPEIQPHIKVGGLSPASQQLVEIARALMLESKVIILDEPTSSLTRQDTEHLFTLILRLKKKGIAIIYISHFLEEVRQIADKISVLRDGKVAAHGLSAKTPLPKLVQLMVGRRLKEMYPRSKGHRMGEVLLKVQGLAGKSLPKEASFTLRRGEVLGVAGLVGAGRTELLRTLFGLDQIKKGQIRLGGFVGTYSPARRLNQGMGMLSEDRKGEGLAARRTLAENMTLSKLKWWVSPSGQGVTAKGWIERLDIRCQSPFQRLGELSGGNQQKVALARLLYHDVDVLLLDEPTRGIDVASKAQIYALIDGLAKQGKSILLVSSYLPELLGVCDRIAVMYRGELSEAKPTRTWNEKNLMIATSASGTAK